MQINFSKKFMKTLRLSLGLSELQMAKHLNVSVNEYSAFEEEPMKFGGQIVDDYLSLLDTVNGPSNLSHMFLEFVKFDLQTSCGAISIFEHFPLRLVQDEPEASTI